MIPDAAIEAAAKAHFERDGGRWDDWTHEEKAEELDDMHAALEAAAPHMREQANEDRETLEERVKLIVQDVAMTVDYTGRLYAAVQEIMAITKPRTGQVIQEAATRAEIQAEVLIHARDVIACSLATAEKWRYDRVCADFQEMIDAAQAGKLRKP